MEKDINLSLNTEMRGGECWVIIRVGSYPQREVAALGPRTVLTLAATVANNTPGFEHLFKHIVETVMIDDPSL